MSRSVNESQTFLLIFFFKVVAWVSAVVNSSGFAAHGENRLQLYHWNTEKFKGSFDLGQNRRKISTFPPLSPKPIRQNGVFWHLRGFSAERMLRRCHFFAAQFFCFFMRFLIWHLPCTWKLNPALKQVQSVQFTNLALMLLSFTGPLNLRSHREEDKGKLLWMLLLMM